MSPENQTPFDETFTPVDIDGFDTAWEDAKPKPLPPARYEVIIDAGEDNRHYQFKTIDAPQSKINGFLTVKLLCRVQNDEVPDHNGRPLNIDFIVQGFGLPSFLAFAKTVSPPVSWKKSTRLVEKDGSSEIMELFKGSAFLADVIEQIDKETGKPNGYNQIAKLNRKFPAVYNLQGKSIAEIADKIG